MAKRVGKYKITKRESALNLTDGGTIHGDLTVTGATTLVGSLEASNSTLKITGISELADTARTSSLVTGQLFIIGASYFTGSSTDGVNNTHERTNYAARGNAFDVLCISK